jgi:beta-1,4-mannosyltransferase
MSQAANRKLHVVVVVLGDLGRSPRMQYHALSLLEAGHTVSLVGYRGEDLIPDLCKTSARLSVVRFSVPSPKILQKSLPIYLVWRIASLCLYLMYALFLSVPAKHKQKVDCVLVQNPPAMPLLLIAYLYCRVQGLLKRHRPGLVIDWHNLGYTMLSNAIFSSIARLYEQVMAPLADGHLCVTSAMKGFLNQHFKIPVGAIHILYDCPPAMFQPLSTSDQHQLLAKLHSNLCSKCPRPWYQNLNAPDQTLLTETNSARGYVPRRGRPALVTSSTSWTADEDFGQLLEAVVALDQIIIRRQSSLKVLVVVTGKGPQKLFYQEKISKLSLHNVAIQTIWLEPTDYPLLLACADVGVSLHTSTSGLDLPMKILDLFGCHVPVCARNFQCLSELVEDDENGRTFESSEELAAQLWYLLKPLADKQKGALEPHAYGELSRYSKKLEGRERWNDNWTKHALPALLHAAKVEGAN